MATDGERFANRYDLQGELGRGGMGRVLLALDATRDHRPVALKLLRLDKAQARPESREMLSREFEVMTHLHHPNLVEVYDYAVEPECFFSMEYVEGKELRHVVLDDDELVAVVVQICRALEYIHSRGLVHLDIKPSNLIVQRRSGAGLHVKLMDFGVSTHSRSIALRGYTLGYVAPEVIEGRDFDGRADLFALGMTIGLQRRGGGPDSEQAADTATQPVQETREDPRGQSALPASNYELLPEVLRPIVERLVRRDPEERYASAAQVIEAIGEARGVAIPVETAATRAGYLAARRLSGRQLELSALRDAFAMACAGAAQKVRVVGPPGVGKSRLVSELRVEAQLRGAVVLEAGGVPDEAASYGVVRRWLPSLMASADATPSSGADAIELDTDTRRELERFAHGDERRAAGLTNGAVELQPEALGSRLADAVVRLVAIVAARRELVLIVEDEPWVDAASRRLLARLSDEIDAGRVERLLLVLTERIASGIDTSTHSDGKLIVLGAMSTSEVEAFVAALVGPTVFTPEQIARIAAAADGSSLYVCELLRALADDAILTRRTGSGGGSEGWQLATEPYATYVLPTRIDALIERRLAALQPSLRRALEVAALLGERFVPSVLTNGATPLATRLDLLELVARNFLVAEGRRLRFGHALVRHVAAATMTNAAEVAGMLAMALEGEAGEPSEIARLYEISTTPWLALPSLNEATRRARVLFDYDAAADLLQRARTIVTEHADALDSPDELAYALELEWLQALRRANRSDRVDGDALFASPGFAAPERQALLALELAQLAQLRGHYADLDELATRALSLLPSSSPKLRTLGHRLRGLGRYHSGQLSAALAELNAAVEIAGHAGAADPLTLVAALTDRGFVYGYAGDTRRAVLDHEAALKGLNSMFGAAPADTVAQVLQESVWFARASVQNNLGFAYWLLGSYEKASKHLELALAIRRQTRDRYGEGVTRNNLGNVARHLGQLTDAAAHYEAAIELSRATGNALYEAIAENNLGQVHDERGEHRAAETLYRVALSRARALGDRIREGDNLGSLGACLLYLGELVEARRMLADAVEVRAAIGDRAYLLIDRSFLARVEAALGDRAAANASLATTAALLADIDQGVEQVQIVHYNVYAAYRALGDSVAAALALAEARAVLATQAAKLPSTVQRGFWSRRLHREISDAGAATP